MTDINDPIQITSPEPARSLTAAVARLRSVAVQQHRRSLGFMMAAIIAAGAVSAAAWFLQDPMDRDEVHFSLTCGLGLATVLVGVLISRIVFPLVRAECPRCGCDWNTESDNDLHTWLAWRNCPGCGLRLSTAAECPQSPEQPLTPTDPHGCRQDAQRNCP